MTNTTELSPMSTGLRFFWSEREEDGAEVFYARRSDGSPAQALTTEELATAEELILAHAA